MSKRRKKPIEKHMPIKGQQSAERPKVMGKLLTATLKRRALKLKASQKLAHRDSTPDKHSVNLALLSARL